MKRHRLLVLMVFLLPLAVFCGALSGEQPSDPPGPAFLVVAYLPDYRVEAVDPDAAAPVTDLIYFSIEPKATGELNSERLTDKALNKLKEMRKRHKKRLLVAIGGWGRSKAFPRVAADPQRRSRLTRSLVRFCVDNGFDGVDFDWEHPANDAENAAYARLLSEVKEAFRPKRLLVTVALADWQNPGAAAYEAVDRIHIMAYDHGGERHSTFEQAVADVKAFEARKVPRAKLCLGLPFYGRGMKDRKLQMSYAEVMRQYRPAPEADAVGGVYFNGIETIRRKTRFARGHGLGGVMVWELGQDASGKASLLRAIQEASKAR
jgi:GH18 family chitinase